MNDRTRHPLRGLAGLLLVAATAAGVVAATWQLTAPRIAENEQRLQERGLTQVLPGVDHDNLLQETRREVHATRHLGDAPSPLWTALRDGRPVAVVLQATARDGYNGPIRLLLGISAGGELLGVRAIAHRETPGLGDFIEIAKSDWMLQFDGRRLGRPPPERWALTRDGGEFDAATGATVTARAVVQATRNALLYFEAHREQLLTAPATGAAATTDSEP